MTALEMFDMIVNTVTSVMKRKAGHLYIFLAAVIVFIILAVILVLMQ